MHSRTWSGPTETGWISYSSPMHSWFEPLQKVLSRESSAVLVTVIAVDGSVPREVGATLIVSADGTDGTIGGGNLEYSSITRAREMLAACIESSGTEKQSGANSEKECLQLSLGPSLGQCCGGRVELLFEHVCSRTGWVSELTIGHQLSGHHSSASERWLFRQLDNKVAIVSTLEDFQKQVSPGETSASKKAALVTSARDNSRWFCTPLRENVPAVQVYGAGHVGQAVVAQLSLMTCHISWLDHREEWLELQPELSVNRVLTDTPEDEVVQTPTTACHVVMTHSHATDFDICHTVLKHGHFGYLGLIGSETKRRTFRKRFTQRGLDDDLIDRMRCPIGNLQLKSSVPSVIALNLAAELTLLWEQSGIVEG